ncbi:MAG TPA: hypothetical protein VLW44_01470 [Streptosporangiaceae bacterium]|nr:hypothetical protein [Streptosporangiaceae bacterium]
MAGDQGSPGPPPERPAPGGGRGSRPPAAAGASPAGEPGLLLADLARLRRQTRTARHAYWFPLILFGVLTCGAAPLYVAAAAPPPASGAYAVRSGPVLLGGTPFGTSTFYIGWYWAVALVGGYLLTLVWYRRHAGRVGVRTPARGYLITGVVLTVLALAIPPLTGWLHVLSLVWLPFGDVWIRGTLAFLIIAIGLWVLAWAERSRVLAVIALVYTGAALLSSLYNVENVVFRLGWNPGRSAFAWQLTALPNVLLPAAVLLVAGCGAFLAQRRQGRT